MNGIWITRDGRVLRVIDMTDNHLDNAIHYLDERIQDLTKHKKMLVKEYNRRNGFWTNLIKFLRS
jgi:hypothetical protein